MTDKEKIAVIQAQIDGKELQLRSIGRERSDFEYYENWSARRRGPQCDFNFSFYEYRVKPSNIVRLNKEYVAEIKTFNTVVGCQVIPNSKILEVASKIKELQ